ncbi:MAG: flavodoxin domain-containing protein [Bacillaceae bacterium]|nr:flavodoxin domain-containing protein [Bacillaceae bacterium]
MKAVIVYTSVTGNTETLAKMIQSSLMSYFECVDIFKIEEFSLGKMEEYAVVVIGTYTWGNGAIPKEMVELYTAFEALDTKHITTGVFGTGDTFYPHYCGAIDKFRDMLFIQTNLAVTLKVELLPQAQEEKKCRKFAKILFERLNEWEGQKP